MEKVEIQTCKDLIKNIDKHFLDDYILFLSEGNYGGQTLYFMEKNGNAVALLNWYFEGDYNDSIILSNMNVNTYHRKKGYGTRLQEVRENLGIQLGAKCSYLWVDKNTWQYDWYIRRGYEYYPENEHEDSNWTKMKKQLKEI